MITNTTLKAILELIQFKEIKEIIELLGVNYEQ